jgi:hypothetical protein
MCWKTFASDARGEARYGRPAIGCHQVGGGSGPPEITLCGRNGAGDIACCSSGDGCFVYTTLPSM